MIGGIYLVEFSFDRDEFRPDPSSRRDEARQRDQREAERREQERMSRERQDMAREMEQDANDAAFRRVFNNPDISIPESIRDMINDPSMIIDKNMTIRRRSGSAFASQFRRDKILPGKRTRKKSKTDKNMSKALREANSRLRTKNGKLRKGKTQGDVMRLAHRLRKKM